MSGLEYDVRLLADQTDPCHHNAVIQWMEFLVKYIRNRTSDAFLVEDVVQETMYKAYKALQNNSYRPKENNDNGRAWICTIASNTLKSVFRRNGRQIYSAAGYTPNLPHFFQPSPSPPFHP